MLDPEIVQMQNEFLERNRERTRWIILDAVSGYEVHCHTKDGVAPATSYPTKRLAAARLLQLLGIGPVAPQDHPERICVGSIQQEESAGRAPDRASAGSVAPACATPDPADPMPSAQSGETPRTNAAALSLKDSFGFPHTVVPVDFARQLERELSALRSREQTDGWVSTTERLPQPKTWVLVHNGKWTGVGAHYPAGDDPEHWRSESHEFIELIGPKVTHWRPLPNPPESV